MKSFLQFCAAVLFLTMAVCTVWVAHDVDTLEKSITMDFSTIQSDLHTSAQDVHQQLSGIQPVIKSMDQVAQLEAQSFASQQKEFAKTQRALRASIDFTNKSLNEPVTGLFARVGSDVDASSKNLDEQLTESSTAAQLALESLAHSTETLTFLLNDPAIAQTATHLNNSAAQLELTSTNVQKTSADIEEAVHRLTRPPSLAKRIGMGILQIGGELGSIFAGFVR